MSLRFSGHDTFHCKQQWLLKGSHFMNNKGYSAFNNPLEAIQELGVGKNMVSSLKYWLEAFYIVSNHNFTDFGKIIFGEDQLDPYLEDEGTVWLLQYYICQNGHASIFKIIFSEFFSDKVSYEFTESKVINYLNRIISERDLKAISENTLATDFKVFIRSYVASSNESKTLEDDFNSPLLELKLIDSIGGGNFSLNKTERNIPLHIFAYSVLDIAEKQNLTSVNFKTLQDTIGNYFCLSNDSLEDHILKLKNISPLFVYNEDAGMANIQLKDNILQQKTKILKRHYEEY